MYGELSRTKALVSVLADAKVTDTDGNDVDLSAFTVDRAKVEAEAAAAAAAQEAEEEADPSQFIINVDDVPEVSELDEVEIVEEDDTED